MKTTIQANKLIIELDIQTPAPSGSGKNLVIATTHGIVSTDVQFNGKTVKLGVNAFIAAH
jgi:hypothetical protein